MADSDHAFILKKALRELDIRVWNDWLGRQPQPYPVDLSGMNLEGANLEDVNLADSLLDGVNLHRANLRNAKLAGARFLNSILDATDCSNATIGASRWKHYSDTSTLYSTTFLDVDLSGVRGLDTVHHRGPSYIDLGTFYRSGGAIPESFLRGCGVPDIMITFARSLTGKAIEYYSCFIAYSSKDKRFARHLYKSLQKNGVRVWFAPENLKTGDLIEDSIDQAVRIYDKLILILSENSIERAWVRREYSKAIEKELRERRLVLFPIRIDDSIFQTSEQWAFDIRKRQISEFLNWKTPSEYQKSLSRLLRDLQGSQVENKSISESST